MKFFIDENLPPAIVVPLGSIFHRHIFRSASDEGLGGFKDLDLFRALKTRRFNAIVTSDRNQVWRNDAERKALYNNRIHWVCVTQPATSGLHLIACWAANLTAALPHILGEMQSSAKDPTWFSVKGIPIESRQRMTSGDLWRASWGKKPPTPLRKTTPRPRQRKPITPSDGD